MPIGNLRQLANSQTRAVNPNFPATLFVSTGYTVDANHVQVPSYDRSVVIAQIQPMTTGDIKQLDALNVQGAEKIIFLNGAALAISRIKRLGGDLIVFADGTLPEGNTWLVKANLEQWGGSTWCKVAVSLQDDIPDPT